MGKTKRTQFTVDTKGGVVSIQLHLDRHKEAASVTVEMGHASFAPGALPCTMPVAELIQQPIEAAGRSIQFTGVSVGNPHCVVFKELGDSWSRADLLALGPALEHHAFFPKRTNVQLAVPTGPQEIFILIWERGAGETQASGSSSCAAASAAVRLGLVRSPVTVKMPGGTLHIKVGADYALTMKGPVVEVARGTLSPSFVRSLR
jgi:diaminopimelate epimerase